MPTGSIVNVTDICVTYRFEEGQGITNFTWEHSPWETYNVSERDYEHASRNGSRRYVPTKWVLNSNQLGCNSTGFVSIDGADYYKDMWFYYHWNDPILNETWRSHFEADPYSSQEEHWESWGFAPSDKDNYSCDTQNNVYQVLEFFPYLAFHTNQRQWGFSYEWIFITVIANSVFLFGLYILWLECDINSELCKKGRRLGVWRAIADLSEAMKEDLGTDTCAYSNEELSLRLSKMDYIKYYVDESAEKEVAHIGLSSRPSARVRLRWNQKYGGKDI